MPSTADTSRDKGRIPRYLQRARSKSQPASVSGVPAIVSRRLREVNSLRFYSSDVCTVLGQKSPGTVSAWVEESQANVECTNHLKRLFYFSSIEEIP
jgi:hypothetical protein